MKKQVTLKIQGIVQGVFYRDTAREQAENLGITGWVRNEADGSVTLVAQGEEAAIKKLIDWCYQGPPAAKVENIDIKWQKEITEEFPSFIIKY
jgi:acylphosphatase